MMDHWECLGRRLTPLPEGKCLLGLSGGADSVALLMMLLPMRGQRGFSLEAAHVNHGLRGEESDADEAFVRALCAERAVPLHVERLDLRGRRDENAAREARYAAFERILRDEGIPTLILAHQREDQAETFLLRLLRGAGPEGLRAMRSREARPGYTLLRPMLDISGHELRQALLTEGLSWREDRTNQTPDYLRNRVRLELLPQMEKLNPGVARHLARAAELIGKDGAALDVRAEQLLREHSGPGWIEVACLRAEPEAVQSRMLRRWWKRYGPTLEERALSYEQTRRLEGLLEAPFGETVNLPAGWRARRRKDRLILLAEKKNPAPAGENEKEAWRHAREEKKEQSHD